MGSSETAASCTGSNLLYPAGVMIVAHTEAGKIRGTCFGAVSPMRKCIFWLLQRGSLPLRRAYLCLRREFPSGRATGLVLMDEVRCTWSMAVRTGSGGSTPARLPRRRSDCSRVFPAVFANDCLTGGRSEEGFLGNWCQKLPGLAPALTCCTLQVS